MKKSQATTSLSLNKAIAAFSIPGARMMIMHCMDGDHYYVVPGGRVSNDDAATLMERTNVEVFDDGLFPGHSQSWRIVTA